MGRTKRKFIEGHSYFEMYNFTRKLSFWELEESYKAVETYMEQSHDMQIPVCVRLKTGDIRVKKYDEQIGLDPRNYYSNAKDLAYIVRASYRSRQAIRDRFFLHDIRKFTRPDIGKANAMELLNLKIFLENLDGQWIYLDADNDDNGKYYILETVSPEVIRTIYKHDLTSRKSRNLFLSRYVESEKMAQLDKKQIVNFVNHFRPVENLLREVEEAIGNL